MAALPKKSFTKKLKSLVLIKKWENINFLRDILLQRFQWTIKKQNWHSCYEFMPKLPKLISNFTISSKSSSAVIDCLLTDRQKKFTKLWAVFRSNSGKKSRIKVFIDSFFSLKKILWSLQIEFLKSCKSLCLKSENSSIKHRNEK